MSQWLAKLRIKLFYSFAKLVEIKPFLKIDPNSYCPACGNRKGRINAVALDQPDQGGSKVGLQRTCEICNYAHLLPSVTVIKHHLLEAEADDEEREVRQMQNDKRTKNVRGAVKVNGEVVS